MGDPAKATTEQMAVASAFMWVQATRLVLQAGPFSLVDREYQIKWLQENHPNQCFIKGAQIGAPLALDTLIPTPDGWTTMGEIKPGDRVFGEDGNAYQVLGVSDIFHGRDCYRLTFSDGSEFVTDGSHRWYVRNVKHNKYKVVTSEELHKTHRYRGGQRARYAVDLSMPIFLPEKDLPIDPYVFGLWLGDGSSNAPHITSSEKDVDEYLPILAERGYEPVVVAADKRNQSIRTMRFGFQKQLVELGVFRNKHIPQAYLRGSLDQRLELLRGLIDSDGHINGVGYVDFYNNNLNLINHAHELVASLGYKPYKKFKGYTYSWDRTERRNKSYRVCFRSDTKTKLAHLKRKSGNQSSPSRAKECSSRYIVDVESIDSVDTRCIAVDNPNKLFLVGESFIPTHNTIIQILKSIHGMKTGRYPQGVMYLFPTSDDVSDFSKSQFKPLIDENRSINRFVQSTDSNTVKKIGRSMLYLRGARATRQHGTKKTSTKLKTAATDRLVFDERDEMAEDMVELAYARTGASKITDPRVEFSGERAFLSTPTIPDYGIDAQYHASDGRVWMLKCPKCGRYTCLELEFPDCLVRRGVRDDQPATSVTSFKGSPAIRPGVVRICTKCRDSEIRPRDGIWIAQRPTVKDLVGWWISQLNTVTMNPANILNLYEKPKDDAQLSEVYNSMLGKAWIQAENRLTENQVHACSSVEPMAGQHSGPCGMGVDVGTNLHVLIGQRPYGQTVKIIKIAEVTSFNDVHDLAKRFGVKCAVFDLNPETRAVRAYRASASYPVYGCYYNEHQKGVYAWNEKNGTVMVNRTELCDSTHDMIAKPGYCELPRRDRVVEEYARQMCNMAKVLDENKDTGTKIYRYWKLGADHYRHASNYLYLALERTPRAAIATAGAEQPEEDYYYG